LITFELEQYAAAGESLVFVAVQDGKVYDRALIAAFREDHAARHFTDFLNTVAREHGFQPDSCG
jgi:hypothetical protein